MPKMLGYVPSDSSERKVYEALKQQLPGDWLVLSNVAWAVRRWDERRNRPGEVRDGQADFVVFVPQMGFAVLEVKGTKEVRIDDDGRWYRMEGGQTVPIGPKIPPEQASHNMHQLGRMLALEWGLTAFPYLYAFLVVYPQGTITAGRFTTYDSSTVVLEAQMGDLVSRVRKALLARGDARQGDGFSHERALEASRFLLGHGLVVSKVDGPVDVQEDADRINTLTRQQFAALQGVFAHPRVAVVGPAGSGKTVLAIWRLAALVEEGNSAVFLCFNINLAAYLRQRHPHLASHIRHVDSFLASIASSAQRQEGRSKEDFFGEDLPGAVLDLASAWPEERRYDAILVDEGQDFNESRLIAILELLKRDNGLYAFFSDWEQDVYKRSSSGPIGVEVVFALGHNCRNTVRINQTCNHATGKLVPSMPGLPEGVDPVIENVDSPRAAAARAWQLAADWYTGAGKVAILSRRTLEGSSMALAPSARGLRLVTKVEEWSTEGAVLFSTVRGFKGLEADAVIVVDVDVPPTSAIDVDDLYVACTRPRTRLALLTKSRETRDWLRSWKRGA